ncbi:MAG: DUF4355 domain-containing protein [Clostridia bacterium]|nr:DUF4355 domain-containing protein [Clostridia bacterium]
MEDNKKNMESTAESVEMVKTSKEKVKTFTRDEVNKIVNAETNKTRKKYKEQMKAEKLAKMKSDEELLYQLEKEKIEKDNALAELNEYRLKEEAIKIAREKGLEVSLLNLIDFKNVTSETLSKNIDKLTIVFNKSVEKAVNERLKEEIPITKTTNYYEM